MGRNTKLTIVQILKVIELYKRIQMEAAREMTNAEMALWIIKHWND